MMHFRRFDRSLMYLAAGIIVLGLEMGHTVPAKAEAQAAPTSDGVPMFELDRSWPKPPPNHWVYGGPIGVGVDSHDHVWVLNPPAGMEGKLLNKIALEATEQGPAPPVLAFDQQGTIIRAFGGPSLSYQWPQEKALKYYPDSAGPAEHGLFVDHQDNVWVAGNGHVVLKFSHDGKFLLQLGELWKTGGSNDTKLLGNPTTGDVDAATNEVYIADGYVNVRVIVFDAATGAYKRHWGAYGKKPVDTPDVRDPRSRVKFDPNAPPSSQFFPVHCVRVAKDGLVYVCDRQRNRVQIFRRDGTFVREVFVAKETSVAGPPYGSVWGITFSADAGQRYLYVADSTNRKIWILRRADMQLLGSIDNDGGNHYIATDSKGNLYLPSANGARRFLFKSVSASSAR